MQLNYKEYGSGEDVLIILHGLFGTLDNWHTLAGRFGEFTKVFNLDLRNHGRSPHTPDMDYGLMAEDVSEFMEKQGIESANILGHSMGGKAAMMFASRFPHKTKKLLVADIAPREYGKGHDDVFRAFHEVELAKVEKRSDADEMMKPIISDFSTRQFLLKNIDRDDDGKYQWKMNLEAIEENYDEISAELKFDEPIDLPALFIAGGNSRYIQEKDRKTIKDYFPQAEFEVIEEAGHWLHAEKPDEFFEVVKQFLTK